MSNLSPKELAQIIVQGKQDGKSRDEILSELESKGITQEVALTYFDLIEKTTGLKI